MMNGYHQIMLLIRGKWYPGTWDLYNRSKKAGTFDGVTAVIVLKKLKLFESVLNITEPKKKR